jgi:hypothetical protein
VNDLSSRAHSKSSTVYHAIAAMWPDDHDAMLAVMERAAPPQFRALADHGPGGLEGETGPSSLSNVAMTDPTIAEMWPDDHEAMMAFGHQATGN